MTATTLATTETNTDTAPSVEVEVVSSETADTTLVTASVFDADAILRKAAQDGKNDRNAFAIAIAKVACQSSHTLSQLSELLEAFSVLESSGDLQEITGFSGDDLKVAGKVARHYIAGSISRSLDEQHNALRVDLCDDSNGHGLYFEAGPLGHAGLGLGVVSKETKDGKTTVKRTGAGVYLRADHIMASSVVADSTAAF